jgi:prepilin-type N-terminal cleavage/methylation domain-containing protein
MNTKQKHAFTLAEVLITLTIIGVVAAYSIPAIMQSTQDMELKTKFKKEFSVLNSAYISAIQDNGGPLNDVPIWHDPFLKRLLPYLRTSKICAQWHSFEDGYYPGCPSCDPPIPANNPGDYNGSCGRSTNLKLMNGNTLAISWPDTAGAVLQDSAHILLNHDSVTCDKSISSENRTNSIYNGATVCGAIIIDVNGYGEPNQVGKDIFGIWMTPDRLVPYGSNDSNVSTCNTNSTGWGCAAQYLKN